MSITEDILMVKVLKSIKAQYVKIKNYFYEKINTTTV